MRFFTKELSSTDVEFALSVPSHALGFFSVPEGAHRMQFDAVDINGYIWRFQLSTRLTGHPKPVLLRSSWHPFVEQKGLARSDTVIFFRKQDQENGIQYGVIAQKIIRLMGQDLGFIYR
ncbi:hypothetical protein P3X46_013298 [Hevea brasiliensis]|uniref:TF-B3 domain-containing protein n=1 Tax=Hevea brasiliensis TaxID=3981 RepID=A0ABQ9M343_HEVBR|nr:hypothetical protein P3X46_013298 [Hevea brasiliensis]